MGSVVSRIYNTNSPRTSQEITNEKFLLAVEINDIVKVKKYLSKGAEIECENSTGDKAVHLALVLQYYELLEILISDYGADVNASNSDGISLIALACIHNDVDALKMLMDLGANVNRSMTDGVSLLHYCVLKNFQLTCKYLLNSSQIDVNAKELINQRTPLHYACLKSNLQIVKLLCARNDIDLNAVDVDNSSALLIACKKAENLPIVRFLIACGCDTDVRDARNYSALDVACEAETYEIVRVILSLKTLDRFTHQVTTDYLVAHGLLCTSF